MVELPCLGMGEDVVVWYGFRELGYCCWGGWDKAVRIAGTTIVLQSKSQ